MCIMLSGDEVNRMILHNRRREISLECKVAESGTALPLDPDKSKQGTLMAIFS